MDLGTLLGLLLAAGMIGASVMISGGSPHAFYDSAAITTVCGGMLAALLLCFPITTVARLPAVLYRLVFPQVTNLTVLVQRLVQLAEVARRDGLLALEHRREEIEHPFIRLGVELAVDGTQPDKLEEVLRSEIDAMAHRHREGKGMLDQLGRSAPAFGLMGTLLGLIVMLGNISDPSSIAGGMAVALITTLYGAVLSTASLLPMAEKLAYYSRQEMLAREVVIRGILAIQAGDHPRLIAQRLKVYLPPRTRLQLEGATT
jgi:chemotaxis protein MotA